MVPRACSRRTSSPGSRRPPARACPRSIGEFRLSHSRDRGSPSYRCSVVPVSRPVKSPASGAWYTRYVRSMVGPDARMDQEFEKSQVVRVQHWVAGGASQLERPGLGFSNANFAIISISDDQFVQAAWVDSGRCPASARSMAICRVPQCFAEVGSKCLACRTSTRRFCSRSGIRLEPGLVQDRPVHLDLADGPVFVLIGQIRDRIESRVTSRCEAADVDGRAFVLLEHATQRMPMQDSGCS